jgi:predicted site-specific integrase-resolvase
MSANLITEAIEIVGLQPLADGLGVTYQAIRKWEKAGRLPRTEWTGETNYAALIERLTKRRVTRKALLALPKVAA